MNFFYKSANSILDELEEAARLIEVVVGESDFEVVELCSIGVELELSPSRGCRLGVTVLETGEGDPEISCDALTLVPLLAGDGLVNIWLLDGGLLLL